MRYVQTRNEFHDHTFCPSARRGYETGQVAVDDYYNVCANINQHHQQHRLLTVRIFAFVKSVRVICQRKGLESG